MVALKICNFILPNSYLLARVSQNAFEICDILVLTIKFYKWIGHQIVFLLAYKNICCCFVLLLLGRKCTRLDAQDMDEIEKIGNE